MREQFDMKGESRLYFGTFELFLDFPRQALLDLFAVNIIISYVFNVNHNTPLKRNTLQTPFIGEETCGKIRVRDLPSRSTY